MPSSDTPRANQIPLVVDLDGTLIKTDLLWESLARLLRRNPFQLFAALFWWTRGRAFLKRKLAARVTIDPANLPFNQPVLAFLREQKGTGRKLVLATASDRQMALPVANHLGLFDDVLGSDGKTNLRGANKLKALTEKFGERGFDYAGNAAPDLAVWRRAREAIVVNAGSALVRRVAQTAKLGPTFTDNYAPFGTLKCFLRELFWRSGYLTAIGAGLLLTAAFPKIGIAGLAWVAPALMIAAAQGKRGGDAFGVGYVAGLTYFLSSLYWLELMPGTGLPILAWLALAAYLALYPAVWTWLVSNFTFHAPPTTNHQSLITNHVSSSWFQRTLWSLGGAAIWVALEMMRARLLGGFPWNLIGVSQFKMVPLIQIASVTGVYGISFLVVWMSLSLYSAVCLMLERPNLRFIWQAEIILPFVAVVALFVFGFVRMSGENPPATFLRVTLVQPSIPQTLIWNPAEDDRRFQELLVQSAEALQENNHPLSGSSAFAEATADNPNTLSSSLATGRAALPRRQAGQPALLSSAAENGQLDPNRLTARGAAKTDLLLWPESAVPATDDANCRAISQFAQSNRVWLILNGEDAAPFPDVTNYFNAAYLIGPDGQWQQVYHKRQLVIFGEYVPLARWLPFLKYLTPITGSWTPGDRPVTFEITRWGERLSGQLVRHNLGDGRSSAKADTREPFGETNVTVIGGSAAASPRQTIKTSVLICFEDVFPGLARDAADGDTDFLVNLTNDGWFRQSAEQWQHMANAAFRAVENGLPLIRSANNGVTCWIDASGRVREILRDKSGSVYGVGAMTVDIPVGEGRAPTFYTRHGDWFGWICVILAAPLAIRQTFAHRK